MLPDSTLLKKIALLLLASGQLEFMYNRSYGGSILKFLDWSKTNPKFRVLGGSILTSKLTWVVKTKQHKLALPVISSLVSPKHGW